MRLDLSLALVTDRVTAGIPVSRIFVRAVSPAASSHLREVREAFFGGRGRREDGPPFFAVVALRRGARMRISTFSQTGAIELVEPRTPADQLAGPRSAPPTPKTPGGRGTVGGAEGGG